MVNKEGRDEERGKGEEKGEKGLRESKRDLDKDHTVENGGRR